MIERMISEIAGYLESHKSEAASIDETEERRSLCELLAILIAAG